MSSPYDGHPTIYGCVRTSALTTTAVFIGSTVGCWASSVTLNPLIALATCGSSWAITAAAIEATGERFLTCQQSAEENALNVQACDDAGETPPNGSSVAPEVSYVNEETFYLDLFDEECKTYKIITTLPDGSTVEGTKQTVCTLVPN